jgi:hypothetical protein
MRILLAILVCATVTLLCACDKNTFQTKPRLEVKSLSAEEVFPNQILRVTLNYFDKEGDLGNGVLTYMIMRKSTIPPSVDLLDTIDAVLPEFPDKSQAEIIQPIDYSRLNEISDPLRTDKNDTVYIKFTVRDKEGNQSDTVATKTIVAVQP